MDLGKYNTVFCDYDSDTSEHTFGHVKTRPEAMHDLFVEKDPQRVVMEISPVAGWIVDIARTLGIESEVANTAHDAWRWKNVKKKNDKEDARKLAKLSAMSQIPAVHMPPQEVREKRALIKYRQRLVKHRVSIKNAIRAIFSREGISLPTRKGGWSEEGLKLFKSYAKPLSRISDVTELWRGQLHDELVQYESVTASLNRVETKLNKLAACDERIKRLQSIAGVGPRLAETVVAFLDDPTRFKNSKQVGSYAGLVPRQYQSGQMTRQGKTGGRGNKLLRNLLVQICWTSLRSNEWCRATYKRLLRGSPSRKKIAIVGLARKLLIRCWAMLRDEETWKHDIPAACA
jgi:transposase